MAVPTGRNRVFHLGHGPGHRVRRVRSKGKHPEARDLGIGQTGGVHGHQQIGSIPAGQGSPGPGRQAGIGHPGEKNLHRALGLVFQHPGQTQGHVQGHIGFPQARPGRARVRAPMAGVDEQPKRAIAPGKLLPGQESLALGLGFALQGRGSAGPALLGRRPSRRQGKKRDLVDHHPGNGVLGIQAHGQPEFLQGPRGIALLEIGPAEQGPDAVITRIEPFGPAENLQGFVQPSGAKEIQRFPGQILGRFGGQDLSRPNKQGRAGGSGQTQEKTPIHAALLSSQARTTSSST